MKAVIYIFLTLIIASGISCYSIPQIIKAARLKKLYAEPNHRTAVKTVVPTLGGIALFIGFVISLVIGTSGYEFADVKYIIAAVVMIFFVGLKDDLLDISPRSKLLGQLLSALLLVILSDIRFTSFHGVFGVYDIPYVLSVLFTLFIMMALINAFNLIDGVDGLVSAVSIVASLVLGLWFYFTEHIEYSITAFALMGALISFFWFNVFGKKNKIFMGDTGSLIIGFIISVLIIQFNELSANSQHFFFNIDTPVVSVGILIVPIADTIRVFTIRLLKKRPPFKADRNHIHHKLLNLGLTHIQITSIIITTNVAFILLSFTLKSLGQNINESMLTIGLLGALMSLLPSYILNRRRIKSIQANTHLD